MNEQSPILPSDQFDKLLSRLIGLPNGAHTQPAVVQDVDFYGNTTSYMVQTVKHEGGPTIFITQVQRAGLAALHPAAARAAAGRPAARLDHNADPTAARQAPRRGARRSRNTANVHPRDARQRARHAEAQGREAATEERIMNQEKTAVRELYQSHPRSCGVSAALEGVRQLLKLPDYLPEEKSTPSSR